MKSNKDFDKTEGTVKVKSKYSINIGNLNVRENPGRQYSVIGTAVQGPVEIVEKYDDPDTGIIWGKLAEGGWVDMQYVSEG